MPLAVSKEDFINAVENVNSVKELCDKLKKSKPSVYTYASRFGVKLKKRWSSGIRKQDGYYHYNDERNHRRVMEKHVGRILDRSESVHHIDGNKTNNELENLIILTWDKHEIAHDSLEKCAFELLKQGLISFDRNVGLYKLNKVKG